MKTLKELLHITTIQDRNRDLVCAAVRARHPVEFYYHYGYRTVEPFCLGLVLHGSPRNESLLCYQTGGYAELRDPVGWKLYRLADMEDIAVGNSEFVGDRPGYDPDAIPMEIIYCKVIPLRKAAGPRARSIDEFIHGIPAAPAAPVCLTHNDLMRFFRGTHPHGIPELSTLDELLRLTEVLPENREPAPLPVMPVLEELPPDDPAPVTGGAAPASS